MSLFNLMEDGSLRLEVKIRYNLYSQQSSRFPPPSSSHSTLAKL